MSHVFISHSSKDACAAHDLAQALESRGMVAWVAPGSIPPGADYGAEIDQAIRTAKCMVLLISDTSLASGQVLRELDAAISDRIPVIPVDLTGTHTVPTMEPAWRYRLRVLQTIPWADAQQIAVRVSQHLSHNREEPFEYKEAREVSKSIPRPPVYVADSTLVVVKSYLVASDLTGALRGLGEDVNLVNVPWSNSILEQIADEELDFGIYNQRAVESFNEANPGALVTVDHACYSMGGRNFSVLAHPDSRWVGMDIEQISAAMVKGTRVYVGIKTDRWSNFLRVVKLGADEVLMRGVTVIDTHEPGPAILKSDPDALLIGGQNARFEALSTGAAVEVIDDRDLPAQTRNELKKSSANVLVARRGFIDTLGGQTDFLRNCLRSHLAEAWQNDDEVNRIVRLLVQSCDFQVSGRKEREKITRHILYETYRAGAPVF